jgi:hypothetical protein
MKTHGRLAAIGALAVSAGAFGLWLLIAYISLPSATSGIDFDHGMLAIVSTGVIFAALIAVHLAYARQLFSYTKKKPE